MGISLRHFQQMQDRLAGKHEPPASLPRPSRRAPEVILGIDPSLRGTGFGIIDTAGPAPRALAHGTISCPKPWERSRCFAKISQTLKAEIQKYRPTVCIVEGLFYAQNLKTALIMGEARGAALAAVAEAGIDIFEIAPRKVKQSIVGYGGAQKVAVAKMVQRLLNLAELPAPDAADALALALAHAQQNGRNPMLRPKKI
ncbi:MAG TPA: crossover junction endodeoxyribonuclease RuvC [Verrucomicrobiae bacterium]|nr:crossover junction endodeoxyribonuclease RuvC [Verrucomicrobiae bacterium]